MRVNVNFEIVKDVVCSFAKYHIRINIKIVTYPDSIAKQMPMIEPAILRSIPQAEGMAVSFQCGSFVRFSICVNSDGLAIEDASFRSNGCGYMMATANFVTKWLKGRKFAELHGFNDIVLINVFEREFKTISSERKQCVELCLTALRTLLREYREMRVSKFAGTSALICSCFGISEDAITRVISKNNLETVNAVANNCNAGNGCGSCRMVIEEMILANEIRRL